MTEILVNKDKRNGLIATTLIHLILLFLFLYFGLTHQVPIPEEGILINFGTSAEGMGEIQPDEPTSASVPDASSTPDPSTSEEQVVTQEMAETIEVEKVDKPQPDPKKIEEERKRKEEERLKKLEEERIRKEEEERKKKEQEFKDKMNNVWSNKGGSEGETGKPGDQGDPNGDKNATSHTGTPDGGGDGSGSDKGPSFVLSGRTREKLILPENNTQEDGKVKVEIIVDRKGNVVRATPGVSGSTTTSQYLYKRAQEAAMKWKFSPNPNAPEEQKGIVTFVFELE